MTTPSIDPFDELPGGLMIWVLIASELLVFGAGLASFLAMRIAEPTGFASAQEMLHSGRAGTNTMVLVTSGLAAAMAERACTVHRIASARLWIAGAVILGAVFLAIKASEFLDLARMGISTETHVYFMFYYLLTGFHAAHVVAGVGILALVSWKCQTEPVRAAVAFWHMVDLVWILLFPTIYLLP